MSTGNPFMNGQGGMAPSTRRPVITGFSMQPANIPYYLTRPEARDNLTGGMSPMPSTLTFAGEEMEMPIYETQESILEGLATLDATDPGEFKKLNDLLRLTRFDSWESFLDSAALSGQPWDEYLEFRVKTDQGLYGTGGGGGGGTSSQVYLSSESQAGQMLDQAFTNYLGRTATDEEVATWQELLNEAQRQNPTVTTSSGRSSVTQGAFDATRFAREYAQSQEGYAERYAALNFMNSLDRVLSGSRNSLDEFAEGM